MNAMERLTEWVLSARSGIAFTGAGISTESGVPDFRTPGGIWSRHRIIQYSEFLSSRQARVTFWKQRAEVYKDMVRASPNVGHMALAQLEQSGRISAVITQNIDGLHQRAGSRRVIEIHGTARIIACTACRKEWEPDEVLAWIEAGDQAPDCDLCGAPLKSKTISFGQPMPVLEMNQAMTLSRNADFFFAIGTSLVVEPAASLPRLAKQRGAKLAILNKSQTPLDDLADLTIRDPIGKTLATLMQRLQTSGTP